jgi:RNA polymerase sigma factor (sigma-70 family)
MIGKGCGRADICRVMDDSDLWSRVRGGDASAFAVLYERHASAVYRFCFWRLADAALAEDLSAAVFLEAWAGRARVDLAGGSLLPWLLGVAHNLVRNQWRSARRRRAALSRLPPLREAPDPADDVAARVDAERRMRAVRAALVRLPAREREVMEMCVWAGLSPAEAAVALRIPVGTVHSRLHRARARLDRYVREATTPTGHEPGDSAVLSRPSMEVRDGS